jgi:uncharacterized protein (DUF433 family)
MTIEEALWQDDDRMSGAVCFRHTRIPVSIFFEHVEANRLNEFRTGFPDVTEEQMSAVIEASQSLIRELFQKRKSA